jgi:outer membrane protein OmpA-like peptidoglycan-associated protein
MAACGARQPSPGELLDHGRAMEPLPAASWPPATAALDDTCELAPVYFEVDSSRLSEMARDQLWQNTRCIREQHLARVRLVGMTDPRGTEEYNLALGESRAAAASEFVNAMGMDALLVVSTLGEESATGSEEDSWASDRRVDLIPE